MCHGAVSLFQRGGGDFKEQSAAAPANAELLPHAAQPT